MDRIELGPLRARRVVAPRTTTENDGAKSPLTVVLFHGFGAPGDDLVALADAIDAPPGTTFVFPEAPHALADFVLQPLLGDARAWWLIDMARLERAIRTGELRDLSKEVPEGLREAREAALACLSALGPVDRLVVGGFSQGSMLALDLALRSSIPLAGLVVLSGTLIAEDEWSPLFAARRSVPVFQSHGTDDPILPFVIAERLRDVLARAGSRVTFDRFEGGHGIAPTTLRELGRWLRAL